MFLLETSGRPTPINAEHKAGCDSLLDITGCERHSSITLRLSVRLHLQVPRRGHEHVRRESSQHPLQAVPGATGQPADRRPPRGRTAHLLHGRHQRHADHAALDGECTLTRDIQKTSGPFSYFLNYDGSLKLFLVARPQVIDYYRHFSID